MIDEMATVLDPNPLPDFVETKTSRIGSKTNQNRVKEIIKELLEKEIH